MKYVGKFEQHVVIRGLDEVYFTIIFLNGLKQDIEVELKLYKHVTLFAMMKKSRHMEEKYDYFLGKI